MGAESLSWRDDAGLDGLVDEPLPGGVERRFRQRLRTSIDGKQEHFFSTLLEDATIVDITSVLPHAQDPAKADYTQLIEVSLAYRKITWEHTVAGTSGSDDWRAPLTA